MTLCDLMPAALSERSQLSRWNFATLASLTITALALGRSFAMRAPVSCKRPPPMAMS
jgi:hypothetical protein